MDSENDLIGCRFGNLVVIEKIVDKRFTRRLRWLCKCDCGKEVTHIAFRLKTGRAKSCGCSRMNVHTSHGMSKTKLYRKWAGMKKRCENKNFGQYKNYGGRGITVCEEWSNSFESFMEWSINNCYSDNLELDRIDNNGGYNPKNCRYVNRITNCNNKRNTQNIEINGVKKPLMDWVRETGLSRSAICGRIKKGFTGEEIIQPKMNPGPKGSEPIAESDLHRISTQSSVLDGAICKGPGERGRTEHLVDC